MQVHNYQSSSQNNPSSFVLQSPAHAVSVSSSAPLVMSGVTVDDVRLQYIPFFDDSV